jgi:hypothetical protein
VACDEETIAGTDADLLNLARLAERSGKECSTGDEEAGFDDNSSCEGVLADLTPGFFERSSLGVCVLTTGFVEVVSAVRDAHIEATAATLPPRPPRADLISYLISGA